MGDFLPDVSVRMNVSFSAHNASDVAQPKSHMAVRLSNPADATPPTASPLIPATVSPHISVQQASQGIPKPPGAMPAVAGPKPVIPPPSVVDAAAATQKEPEEHAKEPKKSENAEASGRISADFVARTYWNVHECFDLVSKKVKSVDLLVKLVMRISETYNENAKAHTKVSQKVLDTSSMTRLENSSFTGIWKGFFDMEHMIATRAGQIAADLKTFVCEPLSLFITEAENTLKAAMTEVIATEKHIREVRLNLLKAQKRYYKLMSEADVQYFRCKQGAAEDEKHVHAVKEAEEAYIYAVMVGNASQDTLVEKYVRASQTCYDICLARHERLQKGLSDFLRITNGTVFPELLDGIRKALNHFDTHEDLSVFALEQEVKNIPMPVFYFEPYLPGQGPNAQFLDENMVPPNWDPKEAFSMRLPLTGLLFLQEKFGYHNEKNLPYVLYNLVEVIFRTGGHKVKDLFVKTAPVEDLIAALTKFHHSDFSAIQSPVVAATLLKMWLNCLPQPLIPEMYNIVITDNSIPPANLFSVMDEPQKTTLGFLIKFLKTFEELGKNYNSRKSIVRGIANSLFRCVTYPPPMPPASVLQNSAMTELTPILGTLRQTYYNPEEQMMRIKADEDKDSVHAVGLTDDEIEQKAYIASVLANNNKMLMTLMDTVDTSKFPAIPLPSDMACSIATWVPTTTSEAADEKLRNDGPLAEKQHTRSGTVPTSPLSAHSPIDASPMSPVKPVNTSVIPAMLPSPMQPIAPALAHMQRSGIPQHPSVSSPTTNSPWMVMSPSPIGTPTTDSPKSNSHPQSPTIPPMAGLSSSVPKAFNTLSKSPLSESPQIIENLLSQTVPTQRVPPVSKLAEHSGTPPEVEAITEPAAPVVPATAAPVIPTMTAPTVAAPARPVIPPAGGQMRPVIPPAGSTANMRAGGMPALRPVIPVGGAAVAGTTPGMRPVIPVGGTTGTSGRVFIPTGQPNQVPVTRIPPK